jgi:hypothetical protein
MHTYIHQAVAAAHTLAEKTEDEIERNDKGAALFIDNAPLDVTIQEVKEA